MTTEQQMTVEKLVEAARLLDQAAIHLRRLATSLSEIVLPEEVDE